MRTHGRGRRAQLTHQCVEMELEAQEDGKGESHTPAHAHMSGRVYIPVYIYIYGTVYKCMKTMYENTGY